MKQFWHYGLYDEDDVLTFEDVLSEDRQEPGLIHLDIIATSQRQLRDAETIFVDSPMLNSGFFPSLTHLERHVSETCNSGDSCVQEAFREGSAYCKQGGHPL